VKFNCPSCGRTLNVKDEYAGKKARCPGCKEALTVPFAPEAAEAAAAQPAAAASACPSCGGTLADGAVFCVACGYDLRTGKQLRTVTGGGDPEEEAPDDDEDGYSRDERG